MLFSKLKISIVRSFTGSRGAQPDGNGGEDCLAVLNNFYNVN